jgi:hypothetical protein
LAPSAGAVFGFLLKSGEKLVLKIFNKRNSFFYLEEMNRIQQIFVDENYPAPRILSPIFKFHNTHAGLYNYIAGVKENAHDPIIRTELAKYLAKFSAIVDKYQFKPIKTFMNITTFKLIREFFSISSQASIQSSKRLNSTLSFFR